MTPTEMIGLTVVACSVFYIPVFAWTINKERKLTQQERNVVEVQKSLLQEERRQFFNAMQDKSAANAMTPCRTCAICKRVVHRYRVVSEGVLCKECDVENSKLK